MFLKILITSGSKMLHKNAKSNKNSLLFLLVIDLVEKLTSTKTNLKFLNKHYNNFTSLLKLKKILFC